eukprot:scaffold94736_cov73-Phaeocystis_antarctica.AAC.5
MPHGRTYYIPEHTHAPQGHCQWLAGSSRWGSRDSGSTGWKRSSSKPCAVGLILMTVFSGMETSTHSSRRSPEKYAYSTRRMAWW